MQVKMNVKKIGKKIAVKMMGVVCLNSSPADGYGQKRRITVPKRLLNVLTTDLK